MILCVNSYQYFSRILKKEHPSDKDILYNLYKIENPSYNYDQVTIKQKYLTKRFPKSTFHVNKFKKNQKEKPMKHAEVYNNQKRVSFNGKVPVGSGLPNINIFFIPLSVIPIDNYFENVPQSLISPNKSLSIKE